MLAVPAPARRLRDLGANEDVSQPVPYHIDRPDGKTMNILTFGPIACVLARARNVTDGFRSRKGGGAPGQLDLFRAPLGV